MKDFVIAVILAVLIVITILHDISIYRLGRKVDILQSFFDVIMRQLEDYVLGQKDIPKTERMKTHDYCDICNHKGCGTCIANNLDDYCVPSNYEPTTQTETQNSNLTFEKADTPQTDCKACELDGKADVCKICRVSNYEPQTDCGWK